jgi:adenylate kinase
MRVVVMGPPGVGKGTQSASLAAHLGVPSISTGDLFRAHVRDRTDIGMRVQSLMDTGDYVPDDITDAMVESRTSHADCVPGFVLDGYPRTAHQAERLDVILEERGEQLDLVLSLSAGKDEIGRRLRRRALEQGRSDDRAEVAAHRVEVYLTETAPLLALYSARALVREISSEGTIDDVALRIRTALSSIPARQRKQL